MVKLSKKRLMSFESYKIVDTGIVYYYKILIA